MSSRGYFIDLEYGVVLRVRFTNNQQGQTDHFTVQLELHDPSELEEIWSPVVRYNNAHGSAHIDHNRPYHAKGSNISERAALYTVALQCSVGSRY